MEFSDLPADMQDAFERLKHGSSTIETYMHVALEASVDLAGFSERVEILMDSLVQEAIGTKSVFCGIHEGVVLDAAKFLDLSLIHISEPTRLGMISYAVF